MLADIEMRTLYFDLAWLEREERSESLRAEFVVRVSPLLHQAILALFDDHNTPERTALLIKLAMLELHQAEDSATFIPLPHEPRCRRAADIVLSDPTGDHEIETLAREVGTSARTLSRLFSAETQLSFKSWCQRARVAAAIEKLSTDANVSVKQLASDLGYASVPAFSHAFRQVTGKTPTEFADKGVKLRHCVIRGLDAGIHRYSQGHLVEYGLPGIGDAAYSGDDGQTFNCVEA